MDTYLICHYCITDIFNQTSKCIGVLDIAEKALNLSLLFEQI